MSGSPCPEPTDLTASLHACHACGRQFVVVDRREAGARCVCGAPLTETSLGRGMYELRRPRRARRRPVSTPHTHKEAAVPREPDLGYGESHGYGPAHGGPSGPGDAPATEDPVAEASAAGPAGDQSEPRS